MRRRTDPSLDLDDPLDRIVAAWPHSGRPADLVRELKYGRATSVITELATAMADLAPAADVVTWIPASPSRRRQRGFDQGELLARAIARRRRLPVKRLLRRTDDTAQTARPLEGRLRGPEFAPVGRRLRFKPALLLVDDVYTTGSTLRAAATLLRERGAESVHGLVATRASIHNRPAAAPPGVYDLATPHNPGG
ncbi:MAG: phosphoribosyltransferase family protein [Acidimicrobiales bacterium]|nr:phosphoribosyltransferase family protein [Acidimicrobiales bacterium]